MEVSDEKLTKEIHKILATQTLETLTERKVKREVEKALGLEEFALDSKKDLVKGVISEWITKQSNDQEEEEKEEEVKVNKKKRKQESDEEEKPKKDKKKRKKTASSESEEEEKPKKKSRKSKKDSDSDDSPKKKKKTPKKKSPKKELTATEKKIQKLRAVVKIAGLRAIGLKGLDEDETIDALKKILKDAGLDEKITKENAKKFAQKKEIERELEGLKSRVPVDLPRSSRAARNAKNAGMAPLPNSIGNDFRSKREEVSEDESSSEERSGEDAADEDDEDFVKKKKAVKKSDPINESSGDED